MSVGRRVARLRKNHGESLREASERTGVSHTTVARIEKGEVTGSFHSTLRRIAEGYGVTMEYLQSGRDPRQDIEGTIRRLSPEERSRLYFVSCQTRIRMVLEFLLGEYPGEFSVDQIAQATGCNPETFEMLLDHWNLDLLSTAENLRIAETLSRITGLSAQWFQTGSLGDDPDRLPPDTASAFAGLIRKAARAGIPPQMLDMAIDLLIMKKKQGER